MKKLNEKLENISNDVGVAAHSDPQKQNNCKPVGSGVVSAKNKGITLIALIITIIVMLILVGVTINVAVDGGLFKKAETGAMKTKKEIEKEELIDIALGAYDVTNNKVEESDLNFNGKYTVDNEKSTTQKKVILGPSGILWQIDLETAKVTEYENRNSEKTYKFTINKLGTCKDQITGFLVYTPQTFWNVVGEDLETKEEYLIQGGGDTYLNIVTQDKRVASVSELISGTVSEEAQIVITAMLFPAGKTIEGNAYQEDTVLICAITTSGEGMNLENGNPISYQEFINTYGNVEFEINPVS